MNQKYSRLMMSLTCILVILACGLPAYEIKQVPTTKPAVFQTAVPAKPPAAAVQPSQNLPAPTSAPQETPTEPATPHKLDFNDVYFQGVQSNQWSQGQGLVKILRYVARKDKPEALIPGIEMRSGEITGIVQMASEFISANPGAPETAELEKLLAILIPDGERIMPYARAEGESAFSTSAPAILPADYHNQTVPCLSIWNDGFPEPPSGERPQCAIYRQFAAAGATFRIFYMTGWMDAEAESRNGLLNNTQEALIHAAETYHPWARNGLPNTDVVFTPLSPLDPSTVDADMAALSQTPGRCNMAIFPSALYYLPPNYKQIVAHEMFHCFQYQNISRSSSASAKWWEEGTAEYYSNVAYPDVNEEHTFIDDLDSEILDSSIFNLTYANFAFFQYAGNVLRPDNVIDLLVTLQSSRTHSDYAAAITSFIVDSDDFLHNFGKQYLDHAIADSGGGTIPNFPRPGNRTNMATVPGGQRTINPYEIHWFRLYFPEKYKWQLGITSSGEGRSSAKRPAAAGGWSALPSSFTTACGEREYLILMTTAQPGGTYSLQVNVNNKERTEECDRCVLGTWRLDPQSFDAYEREAVFPSIILNSSDISLVVSFDEEGLSRWMYDSVSLYGKTNPSPGGRAQDITFTGNGYFEVEYQAAETSMTFTNPTGGLNFAFKIGENEITDAADAAALSIGQPPQQATYECHERELTIIPDIGKSVPGWLLHKE